MAEKKLFKLILGLVFFISISSPCHATTLVNETITNGFNFSAKNVAVVTANVPGFLFNLQGLTSPRADVEFYSTEGNVNVKTIANDQGVFYFNNVYSPAQTGEFCFLSYDSHGIANNPLCFSAPPPKTETTISGIILSPTIWLEKNLFQKGETVAVRGRSFPNGQLAVYLFEEERSLWQKIVDIFVPKVLARQGPKLIVQTNDKGDFSFNLPTHKLNLWRMFIGPKIDDETMAAKSNTLEFMAVSPLRSMIAKALFVLISLFNYLKKALTIWWLWVIIFFGAIVILIIKIRQKNEPKKISNVINFLNTIFFKNF